MSWSSRTGAPCMFWGDIINQYPELVPEIPKDVIALEWGYEADHPVCGEVEAVRRVGDSLLRLPRHLEWVSLSGRTDNMLGNIRNAVENGLKYGAIGILNTDWGDAVTGSSFRSATPGSPMARRSVGTPTATTSSTSRPRSMPSPSPTARA